MSDPKRTGRPVMTAGLTGFVLGAATVLLVVWGSGAGRQAMTSPAAAPAVTTVPGAAVPGAAPRPAPDASRPPAPDTGPRGEAGPDGGPQAPPGPGPQAGPIPAPAPEAPAAPPGAPAGPQTGAPPAASPPAVPPQAPASPADVDALRQRRLLLPVQGVRPEQLNDTFGDPRTGHQHEALDIMAARNTPVLAVEDGRLAKIFFSRFGGNTLYQYDPSATYAYYYAHLERYADSLHEGDLLRRGQVIGYVGTSGNAPPNAPHLHFAIFRLGVEKHWWQGVAINPYPVLSQR